MTQTLAIFLDAYRELNSRKLFWFTLIISGMVVLVFALIGINEQGLRVLIWDVPVPFLNTTVISKETFYKSMFVNLGIGFWLAWLATILALVSTAGIFPDLITGGSIDLVLSKPIGRLRLFLTKYASGLLFVLLQVLVFCVASFLTLGIAGGAWEPGVFLAVPVMVVFFSYLFSVCTLLGLVTRSTIAALLLTLLCWFMMFAVGASETTMLHLKIANESRQVSLESQLLRQEANVGRVEGMGNVAGFEILEAYRERAEELRGQLESARSMEGKLDFTHGIMMAIKTCLPKTSETIGLLERWMIDLAELPPPQQDTSRRDSPFGGPKDMQTTLEEVRGRSVWWVIGSSLLFEAAILAIASFLFVRRDF